jgi:hypothetical protein
MPYICYVYPAEGEVPHMEVLPEATLSHARELAESLLRQRPHASRAELWEGETLIGVFRPHVDSRPEALA